MKIILVDLQSKVVQAWKKVFGAADYVNIQHGSIFDVNCDALVSPANSFGFMDGGLDMMISQFFGWHVQKRLQKLILSKHHGELLVGSAEIIKTDHHRIPYVISAPTMRVPMILRDTVNVYLATRAVLILIKFGTFGNGLPIKRSVKTLAFPGMGTGVGNVPPDICARQMKRAIEDISEDKYEFPQSWWEAQERHRLLYSDNLGEL